MDNPDEEKRLFQWLDYLMFGLMLAVSALIGVYFAFFAKHKQNTTSEYLMGGKKMGIFPISMSLIASYVSGITLLGLPSEMYVYGTQYWMAVCPEILVSLTMAFVYLPVFYKLQVTSSYEYLNMRFDGSVRLLGSVLFIIKMILYIPVVIYVPALSFSQVTGFNLHIISPIVCVVCIFYTTLGGLKAVVWTDTLQTIVMFAAVFTVMILGTIQIGGVANIIERNKQGERLDFFNLDIDPTVRHTLWNVIIGNYFSWLSSCSANQAMVQRCLSMPTIRKANMTVLILAIGIVGIVSMSCYTGLVIYATFASCDPISTGTISKADQILPYFVMEISESIPGLPGLFMAGVFSAALSSMSTGLNSMSGVILEDLIRPIYKRPISEEKASLIMKIIVVWIGALCVGLVFLVEKLGTMIQAVKSLTGISSGSLLGIFSLGMFFPWANAKGALSGGISSMILVAWISLGTQTAVARRDITYKIKPMSTEGCFQNVTVIQTEDMISSNVFFLYRVSYLWYVFIGTTTTIVIGSVVSLLFKSETKEDVNLDLFTPVIHRFLRQKRKKETTERNHRDLPMVSNGETNNK